MNIIASLKFNAKSLRLIVIFGLIFLFSRNLLYANVPTGFRAGTASVDITPQAGCILSGYAVEGQRYATGVMHPLKANVVVFSDSRTTAAIVTLDLLNLHLSTVNEIRAKINSLTGIPADHIMLSSSHTHAGPLVGITFEKGVELEPDPRYMHMLQEKIPEGVQKAMRNMKNSVPEYGGGLAHINVNRRLPVEGKITMRPNPLRIVDQRVRVLQFKSGSSKKPIAVFMHYPCHPNIMRGDNTLISGDFVSPAKGYVETKLGNGCIALYAQGCTGNIRPNFTTFDGHFGSGKKADVERLGAILGKEVVRICSDDTEPISEPVVQAGTIDLILPAKKGGMITSEIQAIRLGNTWLISLPGEPVIDLALQIEKLVPGNVIVFGYTNDSIGYLCTEASFAEGGYEPTSSYVKKESEHIIVATAVELYKSMMGN